METKQVIETLKKEAAKDPATNAVLHVWALRKRTRHDVTLQALQQRMKMEGFNHGPGQYKRILELLAELGLGSLQKSATGRTTGLKGIKTTLQSIGAAAVGNVNKLDSSKPRNRFTELPTPAQVHKAVQAKVAQEPGVYVTLNLIINGKRLAIEVPEEFSSEEISTLIYKLSRKT